MREYVTATPIENEVSWLEEGETLNWTSAIFDLKLALAWRQEPRRHRCRLMPETIDEKLSRVLTAAFGTLSCSDAAGRGRLTASRPERLQNLLNLMARR